MNIGKFISRKKQQFHQHQDTSRRKKLEKVEAQTKMLKAQNQRMEEIEQIKSKKRVAKQKNVELRTAGLRRFAAGVKKASNEIKKNTPSDKGNSVWGQSSGSSPSVFHGGGSSSPFLQQTHKPKKKKKSTRGKRTTIIIQD